MNEIENIEKKRQWHAYILSDFLTHFAFCETLVSFVISSNFTAEKEKKIELTDILLSEFTTRKKFDIFLNLIRAKDILPEEEIEVITKRLKKSSDLRNLLAHSYFIADDNNNERKCVTLTYLHNSKGMGHSKDIQFNEYEEKKREISYLIASIQEIIKNNKYDVQ